MSRRTTRPTGEIIFGNKKALAFEDSEDILSDGEESCQLFIAKIEIRGLKISDSMTALQSNWNAPLFCSLWSRNLHPT